MDTSKIENAKILLILNLIFFIIMSFFPVMIDIESNSYTVTFQNYLMGGWLGLILFIIVFLLLIKLRINNATKFAKVGIFFLSINVIVIILIVLTTERYEFASGFFIFLISYAIFAFITAYIARLREKTIVDELKSLTVKQKIKLLEEYGVKINDILNKAAKAKNSERFQEAIDHWESAVDKLRFVQSKLTPQSNNAKEITEQIRKIRIIIDETRGNYSEFLKEKKEREAVEKLKNMMEVSDRLNVDIVRQTLGLDKATFNTKLFEWAKQFNFRIDGDFIIINNNTIDDFIDALDEQFTIWEQLEEKGFKKT